VAIVPYVLSVTNSAIEAKVCVDSENKAAASVALSTVGLVAGYKGKAAASVACSALNVTISLGAGVKKE